MDQSQIKRGIKPATSDDDSEHILSDIRHTRDRMDHTLDELGDKLQPRHLMEEAVDYFWTKERHTGEKAKQSAVKMGRKVIDEVRDHPLPSLLIGAGIVWLLSQQRDKYREEEYGYEEGGPGLKEKASQAIGSAKERMREGAESMKERASDVAEAAKEKLGAAKEKLGSAREKLGSAVESAKMKSSEMKDKTKDYYHRTTETVRQTSDEHPLAVGLACLAAGVIAGVMAPRTRVEDQAFGDTSDRIIDQGKQQAQQVMQKGTEVVDRAVEAGKEEARQQDLTPEGLTGIEGESELKTTGEYKGSGPGI